jgi:hypothetical protein
MNWSRAISAGAVGGLGMTILAAILRALGIIRMNGEMMLGSMLTGTMGDAGTWSLGFAAHMMISILIALAYCAVMQRIGRSGALVGASLSPIHIFIAGFVMGGIGAIHPLVMRGDMPAPGIFAANMGAGGVIFFIVEHVFYGALVGAVYQIRPTAVAPEEAYARPVERIEAGQR